MARSLPGSTIGHRSMQGPVQIPMQAQREPSSTVSGVVPVAEHTQEVFDRETVPI